jgi:hypothetical protein
MRTSLLAGMTTRGTSFLAAGAASAAAGWLLGERGLFCIGRCWLPRVHGEASTGSGPAAPSRRRASRPGTPRP